MEGLELKINKLKEIYTEQINELENLLTNLEGTKYNNYNNNLLEKLIKLIKAADPSSYSIKENSRLIVGESYTIGNEGEELIYKGINVQKRYDLQKGTQTVPKKSCHVFLGKLRIGSSYPWILQTNKCEPFDSTPVDSTKIKLYVKKEQNIPDSAVAPTQASQGGRRYRSTGRGKRVRKNASVSRKLKCKSTKKLHPSSKSKNIKHKT